MSRAGDRVKPKILIVDTYYPDFLSSLSIDRDSTYEANLWKAMQAAFGTANFYSKNLGALGWSAFDMIVNWFELQELWDREHQHNQVLTYKPDVVFLQDLSLFVGRGDYLLAGQCSCPWPGDEKVRRMDVVFTSFPHYVPRIEALGVRAIYNPLAFEPSALDLICPRQQLDVTTMEDWPIQVFVPGMYDPPERIHDCVFIGGSGTPSHWKYGMQVLETVAREIPTFKWWGYGVETLPANSVLRQKYQGQAWGVDMYKILLQSKIVLNRHGEVAEGYTNNMRTFEATGCGALLLTEESKNLWEFFSAKEVVSYLTPGDAIMKIRYYLENDSERAAIAARGQKRTLRDHTYAKRMQTVSTVLQEMLCPA